MSEYLIYILTEVCSWRSDSNRCYPGRCTNEIVESCDCTSGFGGHHCATSKSLWGSRDDNQANMEMPMY